MKRIAHISFLLFLTAVTLLWSCQEKENPTTPEDPTEQEPEKDPGEYKGLIPQGLDELPRVYIHTHGKGVSHEKTEWTELCDITIRVKRAGKDSVAFRADSLKIRGHGNSSWECYPKKPYNLKLKNGANLIGTGSTKRWVLLANWMDRTLLRNDVALEAARRTGLEWTPSGIFVELYLDSDMTEDGYRHVGNYWLGERIHVEKSHFLCDYLFTMDTCNFPYEQDYMTELGFGGDKGYGLPVEVKHPDRDDYTDPEFDKILSDSKDFLSQVEQKIYSWRDDFASLIDVDSFCDWYLLHELTGNEEVNHPKSVYLYARGGKLYMGPVWDFDWGTFKPKEARLLISRTIYFGNVKLPSDGIERAGLLQYPAFKKRLKERWRTLKPKFQTLDTYIDKQADWIRASEAVNYSLWPIYGQAMDGRYYNGNPLEGGEVNQDERLSFQQAVDKMKTSLAQRISNLDVLIEAL